MRKVFVRIFRIILSLIIIAISLSSCSTKEQEELRYLPIVLKDSNRWSILDLKSGKLLLENEFKTEPSDIRHDIFCIENDNGLYDYYTLKDANKSVNTESYLNATSFTPEGVALVVRKDKGISVINTKCEVVADLDPSIIYATSFSNGFARIVNDKQKEGYINTKGEIAIPPAYDKVHNFSEDGLAVVSIEQENAPKKYSVINTSGKTLFEFTANEFSGFGSFYQGLLPVQDTENIVYLVDKSGKVQHTIGKFEYTIPDYLQCINDHIVFLEGQSLGLKDKNGKTTMRAKYDNLLTTPKLCGQYIAEKGNRWGIVDVNENIIIPFEYRKAMVVTKDVYMVIDSDDQTKLINRKQKELIPEDINRISTPYLDVKTLKSDHHIKINAQYIISHISDSSAFGVQKNMTLGDFKAILSRASDEDIKFYGFFHRIPNFKLRYVFEDAIKEREGINYTSIYRYNTKIYATLAYYEPKVEIKGDDLAALFEAFDAQIQELGFRPNSSSSYDYFFSNDQGLSIGMGINQNNNICVIAVISEEPSSMLIPTISRPRYNKK